MGPGTWLLAQGLDSPKQQSVEPLQLHHLGCCPHIVVERIASAVVAGVAEVKQSAWKRQCARLSIAVRVPVNSSRQATLFAYLVTKRRHSYLFALQTGSVEFDGVRVSNEVGSVTVMLAAWPLPLGGLSSNCAP